MIVDRIFVHVADNAGSMTAGAAGAIGSAAVVTGQLPTPEGIPGWVWAFVLAVGPACAWFFAKVLEAVAAYAHMRHVSSVRKHVRLIEQGKIDEAEAAMESSDRWQAWSAAAAAIKKKERERGGK